MNIQEAPFHVVLHHLQHILNYRAVPLFRKLELNPGNAAILFVLKKYGSLSQRELAERVGITPPSMTVALRKMEQQGYIGREPDEKDQRIIRIRILEKGEACVGKVKQSAVQLEETAFAGMTEEERVLLRKLLIRVVDNLSEGSDCGTYVKMRGADR